MTRCMPIASKRLSKTHLANAPRTSETFGRDRFTGRGLMHATTEQKF